MTEFFQIALSLPTVVFSAILLVLSLYWGLVILGALDLDLAEFDLDFDVDADLGIETGVDMGGDIGVDADIDVDVDVDVDVDGAAMPSTSLLITLAGALGLGTVPVTVIVTILTLFAWLVSFVSVFYVTPLVGGGLLVSLLLGVASAALSLPPTMVIIKPLKHLFSTQEGPEGGRGLVGTVCVVSTSRVDMGFGRAKVADDGAGLILPIRCEDESNRLTHGSEVVIIDFDSDLNSYMVEAYDVFLGADASEKGSDLADNISRAFDDFEGQREQEVVLAVEHEIVESAPQKES